VLSFELETVAHRPHGKLNITPAAHVLKQQQKNFTTRLIMKQAFDTFVYSF